MNWLPDGDARCNGHGSDAEGWRDGCQTCLRRTAPRPQIYSVTSPPAVIANRMNRQVECPLLIEPEQKEAE